VRLDPCLVALAHEAEGADSAGGNELDSENGVDLADELVADLDGRFGDGATELQKWSVTWPRAELSSGVM
jgi:hypothetical protein